MSSAGQMQDRIDAAVAAAVAPLIRGLADLTDRVAVLEDRLSKPEARVAPAKKAVARPAVASTKTEAKNA